MTKQEFLQKILKFHESSFDITRPFDAGNSAYDAYASFNVTGTKYVLVKKAELWRADCFEHVFFMCAESLRREDADRVAGDMEMYIEPEIVRGGRKYPDKNHMYTYVTFIFISEKKPAEDALDVLKKFRYMKNYRLGIRGYCEARVLLFDLENRQIIGNRAAKDMVKGYGKIRDLWE